MKSQPTLVTASQQQIQDADVSSSLDQLGALRTSALTGAATVGISLGMTRNATTADWYRANSAPNLWPVEGQVTASFGERIDPFNGEGAFHSGVDIGSNYGHAVIAPADGVVTFADFLGGYGKAIMMDHGHGISTRYGHLSGFAVTPGQQIHRGDTIGYVGSQWTLHRTASSLRSPHQRHSGKPLQIPSHDRRSQRRLPDRQLGHTSVLSFLALALFPSLGYVHRRRKRVFSPGSHARSVLLRTEN